MWFIPKSALDTFRWYTLARSLFTYVSRHRRRGKVPQARGHAAFTTRRVAALARATQQHTMPTCDDCLSSRATVRCATARCSWDVCHSCRSECTSCGRKTCHGHCLGHEQQCMGCDQDFCNKCLQTTEYNEKHCMDCCSTWKNCTNCGANPATWPTCRVALACAVTAQLRAATARRRCALLQPAAARARPTHAASMLSATAVCWAAPSA